MAKKYKRMFKDKRTGKRNMPGDEFVGNDERFKELEALGLVEDVPAVEEFTKEQLVSELKAKGIEHKKSDHKETLLALLNGEE